jgi:hypothetical protein
MSKHSSRVVSSAEINFLGTQESVAGNNDAYAKSHGNIRYVLLHPKKTIFTLFSIKNRHFDDYCLDLAFLNRNFYVA